MTGRGLCARCDTAYGEDPHWDPSLGEEVCQDCCTAITCLPLSVLGDGVQDSAPGRTLRRGDHGTTDDTGAAVNAVAESSTPTGLTVHPTAECERGSEEPVALTAWDDHGQGAQPPVGANPYMSEAPSPGRPDASTPSDTEGAVT